ncbi:MAG TPA: protein phosphatase 2C domain-containing protein [Caulobacteraceae bacterium]|nr:protein phosphatase 2C domain-containing protein [Caulobacteraceae bacterium]
MKAIVSSAGLGATDNDDCAGFAETPAGLCAWVIDGATNVAGADFLNAGRGDVAWYANALSERLAAIAAHGLALADQHAAAADDVAALHRDLVVRLAAPPPLYAHPLAALTMVRLLDGRAELYHLGDCPAFALDDDGGVRRLTVWEPSDAADESRSVVMATQAAVGFAPKAVIADRLPSLRRRREEQLSTRPLDVSAPIAGVAFGGYAASFELAGVAAIVLMSDGFERFAVKYALGDEAAMVRRAVAEGPAPVLAALRAVEEADPDCRRFPRLKPSDDATCLVLRVGG